MAKAKLTSLKGDERKWAIESAAKTLKKTLKDFAALKRDKNLMKAARNFLKQEITDSQKVLKAT